jgi:hypothetical protein
MKVNKLSSASSECEDLEESLYSDDGKINYLLDCGCGTEITLIQLFYQMNYLQYYFYYIPRFLMKAHILMKKKWLEEKKIN